MKKLWKNLEEPEHQQKTPKETQFLPKEHKLSAILSATNNGVSFSKLVTAFLYMFKE